MMPVSRHRNSVYLDRIGGWRAAPPPPSRWPLRRSLAVVFGVSLAAWLAALAWVLS